MSQTHNSEVQQMHTRASSPLVRVFSKRIAWLSIAMCLLLLAGIVGITQKNVGVDAASAKHKVSAPKHAPSPHRPASHGRMMPTMNISPASLSFSESLAHPQVAPQTLTITNNGSRTLYWKTTVTTPQSPVAWVSSYAPAKGTVGANTTIQVAFTVKPSTQLTVGTYTAQLVLRERVTLETSIGGRRLGCQQGH
jgi:Viral BACON domain